MDIKGLEWFLAIADEGNISRAAAKLREDPITAELAMLCVENRGA